MFLSGAIMDSINHQITERFLELTSEGMLYFTHREQFMDWVSKSLAKQLNASHVSLALFDSDQLNYPIRYSSGHNRLPLHLLALDQENFMIKWFRNDMKDLQFIRRTNRIIIQKELMALSHPFFRSLEHDLDLYRTEVCIKIQTPQGLMGCLLIGSRKNLTPYNHTELTFFQILSNQIALEIEKDQYHTNAETDPLTGLLNRASLDKQFIHYRNESKTNQTELALIIVDLDHFKKINDTHGHLMGDQILKVAAEILRSNIRQENPVFRLGGEEFLILMNHLSRDPNKKMSEPEFHVAIYQVMDRIRKSFASRALVAGSAQVPVTVSSGITFYSPATAKSLEELISEADQALYASKHNGRNLISVWPYI